MFSTRATPGQGCNCLQRTRRTSCLFHISFKKNSLHCSLLLFRRKKMAPLCRKCPSRSRQTAALSRGGLRLQNKSKLLNYFGVYFTSGAAPPFLSATRWGHTQSSSGICSACAFSLEPWQRQRYARAMRVVNFSRLLELGKRNYTYNIYRRSKIFEKNII